MLGEACALGAAMCWSTSLILFRRSEEVSAQAMNLFKNLTAIALLALTMLALGQGFDAGRSTADWLRLAVSGVLGIAVADTLVFMALQRLGPGLLAVVDCAYAPTMVVFGVFALGERVGPALLVGGGLVVGGVLAALLERRADATSAHVIRRGVLLGLSGILVMGFGVMLAKPVVEHAHLVEVTFVRMAAGATAQLLWLAAVPAHRGALTVLRPGRHWRTLAPAAVLSAYLSMMLWLGGFKWTTAARAAVLNQLTTVFTIVLARVFLGETLTRRRAVGAATAAAGALLVLVSRG